MSLQTLAGSKGIARAGAPGRLKSAEEATVPEVKGGRSRGQRGAATTRTLSGGCWCDGASRGPALGEGAHAWWGAGQGWSDSGHLES